jgi:NADPH:quinone reductase-like Zn-dependent oxidoreductase
MRAVVWTKYGPPEVLELQERSTPTPQDHEVLIRVRAAGVVKGDCEMRNLTIPGPYRLPMRLYVGWWKPARITVLGMELAGEVAAVGGQVTKYRPGDKVFGCSDVGFGAYAEYACLSEAAALAHMPRNLSFAEAAVVPLGGCDALHFLRRAKVQAGERVLIVGAAGTIGAAAVQLAKIMGAEVTAVDGTHKLMALYALGADKVVDYTREDFTRMGRRYDVVFDVVGKSPYQDCLRILHPGGRYLVANPRLEHLVRGPWSLRTTGKPVITSSADHTAADLVYLKELVEAGRFRPLVDRCFPLEQVVEAHRYVESGRKIGDVALMLA